MHKLRSIHLYLGCIFAPLLLFFAISGIWQMFGFHSDLLDRLSTVHTSRQLKNGADLSSGLMLFFVFIMALSFIATTILGVVMAVKFGRNRKAAFCCLALGVFIPVALILVRMLGQHESMEKHETNPAGTPPNQSMVSPA